MNVTANELDAIIGTSQPAAVPLELGTQHMPPRPFLAPAAADRGEAIARAVAEAVVAALRGETPPAPDAPAADSTPGTARTAP